MLFNSLEYLIFLPVVWGLYWAVRGRVRVGIIVAASYLFYGAWDWRFLSLIMVSTAVDFTLARRMNRLDDDRARLRLLWVSVAVNLGILGTFKYLGFFVESATGALESLGLRSDPVLIEILLPVGISFYTFQTISYTFDVYRRRLEPTDDLLVFAAYVAYFPQLVAGPIERAHHLLPQFLRHPPMPGPDRMASGVALIFLGLLKKVVVADQVAPIANEVFANADSASWTTLLAGVLAFAVQIYFDFSGYTDIARGTSRLFGIELVVNFAQPYLSRHITEFWQRWHISLSNWLRDYLYIPLGGNRQGEWTTYRNLTITMLLGGLWHGASWSFVIWGAMHGVFLAVHRFLRPGATGPDAIPRVREWPAVFGTFVLVCVAWVPFRAQSLGETLDVFGGVLSTRAGSPVLGNDEWLVLALAVLVMVVHDVALRRHRAGAPLRPSDRPVFAGAAMGLIVTLLFLASGDAAPSFIYFQF